MSHSKIHIVRYLVGSVLLIGLMAFTTTKQRGRKVSEMNVRILQENGNYFIDQLEVTNLINDDNRDFVVGKYVNTLDYKTLEARVEENAFVRDAQVFRDIAGRINVKLEQTRPVARLLKDGRNDRYIDADGNLLPLNTRYTARVPILTAHSSIKWEASLYETAFGADLMAFLLYVERDPFWSPQVAQIEVDRNEELFILPQVTKQKIEFGYPENIEKKLRKTKLFYTNILPTKGWNSYAMVNVKYENQIVCK